MSSREARKAEARRRRLAAEHAAQQAQARRRRLRLAGGIAGVVLAVGVAVLTVVGSPQGGPTSADTIAPVAIPAQRVTDLDRAVRLAGAERISYRYAFGINDHTDDPVRYPTNPPTNGPHAFTWTPDGNHAGEPAPPTEQVVHAQEHGRIVLQYRPGLPRRALQQLVALQQESPEHVLLVENATAMPCDVAATAWGQGVLCPTLNDRSFDALRAFRDTFRDKGPELVA